MGSGASTQPMSPTLKKHKSKVVIIPPKEVQQPPKPTIAKLVMKQIDAPRGLSSKMLADLQLTKTRFLVEFQNRFLLKVSQNQIRLIFTEQVPIENSSQLSSKHHGVVLKKLQQKCLCDLAIYRQICIIKMKCIIGQKVKQYQEQLQTNQSYLKLKQIITNQFSQMIKSLIGEIQGKSSVWHSLNLTNKQKIINLINYLHEEGIDSQKIEILHGKQIILNDI